MSAFAQASAALFADANLAEDVTFTPVASGTPVATRAVFQEPTQDVAVYGQTLRLSSLTAWLPVGGSAPVQGDSLTRGAKTYIINAACELDSQGTAWRCPLDPAGTP